MFSFSERFAKRTMQSWMRCGSVNSHGTISKSCSFISSKRYSSTLMEDNTKVGHKVVAAGRPETARPQDIPKTKEFEISDGLWSHKFHFIPEVKEHYFRHLPLISATNPNIAKVARENQKPYSEEDIKILESLPTGLVRKPQGLMDKAALNFMRFLKLFTHAFFREKYNHHAICLETIASVPPMTAAALRHFESLRWMSHDHGWVHVLLEEAENERIHLLTWMEVTNPTFLERLIVVAAQIAYTTFYTGCYLISPKWSHRLTGYLEEEATAAYTQYLEAIDQGILPNGPAPEVAKKYWNLKDDATIRDVVICVRADEMHHRDWNHEVADKIANNDMGGTCEMTKERSSPWI